MLAKMRGGLDSIAVNILLGVLIAAFAIWGVGPGIIGGNQNIVATVGDAEINRVDYERAVRRQAQELQARFQANITTDQLITTFGLDRQILQQMINEAAFSEDQKALGLRATDKQISTILANDERFQLSGVFSKDNLRNLLAQNQITEADFLESIGQDIVRRQLFEAISASAPLPEKMAAKLYAFDNERRTATVIQIAASDMTDITPATEEELQALYEDTKSSYMTDEYRTYTYVLLKPEAYIDQVEATEEEALALYESRLDDFVTPEKRTVLAATFTTEEEAQSFINRVQGGESFTALAAELTDFTEAEISLGALSQADVIQDYSATIADAVFALEQGAVSQPLQALAGWNVFSVTAVATGTERTFESVREELLVEAKKEKATDIMYDTVNLVQDDLAEGMLLDELVTKHNLNLATVTSVDSRGRKEDGSQAVTTNDGIAILQHAYTVEVDDIAELIDIDPNDAAKGMYISVVKDITEPRQKTFDEVRAALISTDTQEKRMAKASEIAEQAMARLTAGETSEAIINDLTGTSYEAKNVGRTSGEESKISQSLRNLLFSLSVNEADLEQAADGNGYMVVRLDKIQPVNLAEDQVKVDAKYEELRLAMKSELIQGYHAALINKLQPTSNSALIQQIFNPEN